MDLDRVIAVRTKKTVYRNGDKCIKVFNSDYTKADVLNEALNHACIEQTGLCVPKLLEITVINGKWSIISEYIKGRTLSQIMQQETDKLDEHLSFFVDLQNTVHSKKNTLLKSMKSKLIHKINESALDSKKRSELCKMVYDMPEDDGVCHGDFNPSNIIINREGVPYILDWSHATHGNALLDAIRTYLLFLFNGENETAQKYLNIYCRKNGIDIESVKQWIPVVAAAYSVKCNESERNFLFSLI